MAVSANDIHIRHIMLFDFRGGLSAAETARHINGVYPEVVTDRTVRRWFQRFGSGNFDLEDKQRPGASPKISEDNLAKMIEENPKLTCQELANIFDLHYNTVLSHLHSIGKRYRAGKWTPHELTPEQKTYRVTVCESLLLRNNNLAFLDRIVTGDEKWCLYINVTRKGQWLSKGEKTVPTPRADLHQKKVMLCVWWNIKGIVHWELLNVGQTVNSDLYCQQLERVKSSLTKLWPALVNRKGVIFHHDNARPHVANITREKLKEFGWEVMLHPPYSPDIAPTDYHLFLALQNYLDDNRFQNKDEVENAIKIFFAKKEQKTYLEAIEVTHTLGKNYRNWWRIL
ncbi:histone-lysine N-methyltransferase SETMAR-like [Oppia nitens]|uniref:histone-lysine N-methyltransferase SETMAR-like n=1 Tax=Oppia nitens TaxID=1686743 RepID=UPI0023D986E5|nr:histone-lysine N-methyltransferase SETMAR-like [Oppia nitens]